MSAPLTSADWLATYYAVPASSHHSDLEAARHALWKWHGLAPGELARHGLTRRVNALFPEDWDCPFFLVDGATCSLCLRHLFVDGDDGCGRCPLRDPCSDECRGHSYSEWIETGDASVMIHELATVVAELEAAEVAEVVDGDAPTE